MKVFITNNIAEAPRTHEVISPEIWENFDELVQKAEAEEIILDDVIEFLQPEKVIDTLTYWISKLCHGGRIIITGTDVYIIAKAFAEHQIDIDEFNGRIHGNPPKRLVNLTMFGLINFLSKFNMKILSKKLERYTYTIEAQRP